MFIPSDASSMRRECVKVNLHAFFIRLYVRGRQIHASDAFASGDVVQGTQWDCKHPGAVDVLRKRVQLLVSHCFYCCASYLKKGKFSFGSRNCDVENVGPCVWNL